MVEDLQADKSRQKRDQLPKQVALWHLNSTLSPPSLLQILVATSTLAWGVNTPAHLVVIKGTEFYDARTKSYVDFPITDVLQMMGRAGRPQYDKQGRSMCSTRL